MKATVAALALLLLGAADATTAPPAAPIADRLQWNARERTAAGAASFAAGETAAAIAAFDAAHRLRGADPRTAFNAGTARIAGDTEAAVGLLDSAARAAGPTLAPDAWYNLGSAKLASGDARGAVEALTEALRREPGRLDAKNNLELALAELERQQEQEQEQRPSPSGNEGARQQPESQGEGSGDDERDEESAQPQQGPDDARSGAQQAEPASGQEPPESPLPQFRDLKDMTAEQAAAILRAVEDLERQQRRERARRAAQERAAVEVDW